MIEAGNVIPMRWLQNKLQQTLHFKRSKKRKNKKKEKPKTKKRRVKKGKLDYFMGVSNG